MPRKYRPRNVSRLRGRNYKQNTPTAKFTLMKYYRVTMPGFLATAPQNSARLEINTSTPFQPLSVQTGFWTAQDTNNEPFGLNSDIYSQYKHVTVRGCHVQMNVTDSPDLPAEGSDTLVEGVAALTRTTAAGFIGNTTDVATLRQAYGTKLKDFQLGSSTLQGGGLPKSARLHQGYSPMKTWKQSALTNEDLKIVNTSGSSNKPTDNTYVVASIHCANDQVTNATLKRFKVQLKITYILTFTEPSYNTNVPLPVDQSYISAPTRASMYRKMNYLYKLGSVASYIPTAVGAAGMYMQATRRRYPTVGYYPQRRPRLPWR